MAGLCFFVNGRKVTVANPDPELPLIKYLRNELQLTGTKLGCHEGGCGSCTVMVSQYDKLLKKPVHHSVNACLAPLCAMEGCHVTTVEGIGNRKAGIHAVQERLAKSHGSQCGFCTPGIVMSMYTLLRNNPKPTLDEIEHAFEGNLCRCTGYRSILTGFQTFASDNCSKGKKGSCPCGKEGGCGRQEKAQAALKSVQGEQGVETQLSEPSKFVPYDASQEPIFPPELILQADQPTPALEFRGERSVWFRPTSLKDMLDLKAKHPEAKIVNGNTELGIEIKFKNCLYPVMICPNAIPELHDIQQNETGVTIGGAVTLTNIEHFLTSLVSKLPSHQTQNFKAMLENLRWFAGPQVRNVASLGGNIATASPISDLNPVLMAAGAVLTVQQAGESTRSIPMCDFFLGYRKTALKPAEIIVSVHVPFTREHEYAIAFKQARRRDDDIAIVNAGMRVFLKHQDQKYTIEDISLCYGGMAPTTVRANQTCKQLLGQPWQEDLVDKAAALLEQDLPLNADAPGGMIEFRRSLTTSFFFKFYLQVSDQLAGVQLDERDKSALNLIERPISQGVQVYEKPLVGKGGIDPVGKPVPHVSGLKQATGEAVYVDDIPRYQGELYGALIMSSQAHAKILSIDTAPALSMTGVSGVYTAKDVPGKNAFGPIVQDEECFASELVQCIGQPLGIVVADTLIHAQRAAKAVKVAYEPLPAIFTIEEAIEHESYHKRDHKIGRGDPEEGFKKSDHILEGEMRCGGQEHFYLETQATIAVPKGEGGEMEIFASTQNPTEAQHVVASVLGVPSNRVVCRVKRLGGGFGGKETRSHPLSAAVAVAAACSGKPVRCMLDRDEDIAFTGGRHPFLARWKVGFTSDGRVQGLDMKMYNNAGFSNDLSVPVLERALFHMDNVYNIPHIRGLGYVCKTNLPTNTAFRGFGGPQGMLFVENWISDVATTCGLPQEHVREINFYKQGDETHFGQVLEQFPIPRMWQELKAFSDYEKRQKEIEAFNQANRWRKRGLSMVPTKFGIAFTVTFLNQAGALVHVYTDGTVLVTHGGTEMGQGLHTKMTQVAARALDIPIEKVFISETSTATVANTSATAASASSDLNGMAVLNACTKIKERLQPFKEKNPDGSFEDWVKAAYMERVDLSAHGFYKTPDIFTIWDEKGARGRPFNYFSYGAACAEVEIDVLTGDHMVRRADIIMDVGASLNPAVDIGQVEGAFVQGYGLFTLEEMVYLNNGATVTKGPGAYKIPGFTDIPVEFNVSLFRNALNPRAVHSSKAVGEPPFFLASSVFFAIKQAIASARQEDGEDAKALFRLDSPATSARIRVACPDKFSKQFPVPDGPVKRWNVTV
eukprot:m.165933 g.165933  ORF g.165933 m.165933 type:complete len:1340 (-) comp24994_c0_seq1:150-4169(-)